MPINGVAIQYKTVINKMAPKVGCFACFHHHRLVTMSVHTHAHHYPLFESETK